MRFQMLYALSFTNQCDASSDASCTSLLIAMDRLNTADYKELLDSLQVLEITKASDRRSHLASVSWMYDLHCNHVDELGSILKRRSDDRRLISREILWVLGTAHLVSEQPNLGNLEQLHQALRQVSHDDMAPLFSALQAWSLVPEGTDVISDLQDRLWDFASRFDPESFGK